MGKIKISDDLTPIPPQSMPMPLKNALERPMDELEAQIRVSESAQATFDSSSTTPSSPEKQLKNYSAVLLKETNENIIKHTRIFLNRFLPTDDLERKEHASHIKRYEKTLRLLQKGVDHTENANRALNPRGIIGESDLKAIEARARKVEWGRCLNIIGRLGRHISEIAQKHPEFAENFTVDLDPSRPSFPLVIHLLKSIKNPPRRNSASEITRESPYGGSTQSSLDSFL